ncbi:MAG TPA: response regulator [Candidatus Limnocylindria bacterium]|nr:response regulator [Candidatus Limnocylindria bacterium]
MARITVVNDNPDFLALVADILETDEHVTTLVDGDVPDALEQVRASNPDVLMIDLRMGSGRLHGWEIAQEVRSDPSLEGLPVLVCSADVEGLKSIQDALDASRNVATLVKPFDIDKLTAAIEQLVAGAGAR